MKFSDYLSFRDQITLLFQGECFSIHYPMFELDSRFIDKNRIPPQSFNYFFTIRIDMKDKNFLKCNLYERYEYLLSLLKEKINNINQDKICIIETKLNETPFTNGFIFKRKIYEAYISFDDRVHISMKMLSH